MTSGALVDREYARRVRQVAAFGTPYNWAQAIWLVDVCKTSYRAGAVEVGVSEREFARRVRRGRKAVRSRIEGEDQGSRRVRRRSADATVGPSRRLPAAIALALAPIAILAACGTETSSNAIDVGHIHDIVERDGELLVGTHQGLFRLNGPNLQRVGDEVHDLMSVAVLPDGDLVASGHPDMRMEKYRVDGAPSFLGLIRSTDIGQTWDVVDLLGQVDFHGLATGAEVLYGGASSGMIWEFTAGDSVAHALGGVDQDLRDLAASPQAEGVMMTTSFDGRVAVTDDAAQTWVFPADIPELVEVEWTADNITSIDIAGVVWTANDVAGPYRQIGQVPDEVDALLVDSRGELWIGTHDGSIWRSADGSDWDLVRSGSA